MRRFFFMVLLAMISILWSGCETVEHSSDNESAPVSAIPWNKPASWEGAGALGGLGFQGTH